MSAPVRCYCCRKKMHGAFAVEVPDPTGSGRSVHVCKRCVEALRAAVEAWREVGKR
jgi:hypothetical protein